MFFGGDDELPGLACVAAFVQTDPGIRIGGKIRFAGAAVNRVRVFGVDSQ